MLKDPRPKSEQTIDMEKLHVASVVAAGPRFYWSLEVIAGLCIALKFAPEA